MTCFIKFWGWNLCILDDTKNSITWNRQKYVFTRTVLWNEIFNGCKSFCSNEFYMFCSFSGNVPILNKPTFYYTWFLLVKTGFKKYYYFLAQTLPVKRPHRKWGDIAKGLAVISSMEVLCFSKNINLLILACILWLGTGSSSLSSGTCLRTWRRRIVPCSPHRYRRSLWFPRQTTPPLWRWSSCGHWLPRPGRRTEAELP